MPDENYPGDMAGLVSYWTENIEAAKKKKKRFTQDGKEMQRYYEQKHDFIYLESAIETAELPFMATHNKIYEFIRLFRPQTFFRAPKPALHAYNPELAPFCRVMEQWLEYVIRESVWKKQGKRSVFQALLLGGGAQIIEHDKVLGFPYPRFLPIEDLLWDPDARYMEDIYWIAIQIEEPIWEVERRFGPEVAALVKPSAMSMTREQSSHRNTGEAPKTNDMVVYYKIYSNMGIGYRGRGFEAAMEQAGLVDEQDDVVLYISPDLKDRPLAIEQWETPYWLDIKPSKWPVSVLWFDESVGDSWPIPHCKFALGEQRALDYFVTFLMRQISITSRKFLPVREDAAPAVKKAIKSGADLTILPIKDVLNGLDMKKMIGSLEFGDASPDLWNVINMLEDMFDKRVGTMEIMYGQTRSQSRSATDSTIKEGFARATPDEMVDMVEDFSGDVMRKLAIASRWHVKPEDIARYLGQEAGQIWAQYQAGDIESLVREIGYGVEVGSSARPNPQKEEQDAEFMFSTMSELYVQAFDLERLNMCVRRLAKAKGIEDPVSYEIVPAPMEQEDQGNEQGSTDQAAQG